MRALKGAGLWLLGALVLAWAFLRGKAAPTRSYSKADLKAAADAWATTVAKAVDDAYQKVVNPGRLDAFMEFFADDTARRTTTAQLAQLRERVAKWRGTQRSWAERGTNTAGTPYTFSTWAIDGESLMRDAQAQVNIAADYSGGRTLRLTWEATANQAVSTVQTGIRDTLNLTAGAIPWWLWGLGLLGLVFKLDMFARTDGYRRR